jgi:hypothetical protein
VTVAGGVQEWVIRVEVPAIRIRRIIMAVRAIVMIITTVIIMIVVQVIVMVAIVVDLMEAEAVEAGMEDIREFSIYDLQFTW